MTSKNKKSKASKNLNSSAGSNSSGWTRSLTLKEQKLYSKRNEVEGKFSKLNINRYAG